MNAPLCRVRTVGAMTSSPVSDQCAPPTEAFGPALVAAVEAAVSPADRARAFRRLHRKAVVVVAAFVASYVAILLVHGWIEGALACAALALSMAGVGFNIQHDGSHNAFFDTHGVKRLSWPNRIAGWSIYFVGPSAARWTSGHVVAHHASPNVVGRDFDIDLGGFGRVAPTQKWKLMHRYQHLYLWFFYSLTAVLMIVGDMTATVSEWRAARSTDRPIPTSTVATMFATKAAFFMGMLVVPALFHPIWVVAVGALAVIMGVGILIALIFQSAHVVTEAEFSDSQRPKGSGWHEWQLRSSLDFSHDRGLGSRMLSWCIGGLDHQAEHHLFPRLPHTLYPHIAPVVTATAKAYGVTRVIQPSLRYAIRSHARHLRAMGQRPEGAETP